MLIEAARFTRLNPSLLSNFERRTGMGYDKVSPEIIPLSPGQMWLRVAGGGNETSLLNEVSCHSPIQVEDCVVTSMRCPSTSMARRTMNSPTPSPSHRVESSRVNASKILESCSPAIPMPVSQTSMRTFWPEQRQPMRIRRFVSVYFMALLMRFRRMPLSSNALLMTDAPVGHTRMSIPFCNEPSAFSWHACLNSASNATGETFASFECL